MARALASARVGPLDGMRTPDGRYFVVRGRLWRTSNPALPPETREQLVRTLMAGRRAVALARTRGDRASLHEARRRVDRAKVALGERGPVWWSDGSPDENRRMVQHTRYAEWFDRMQHLHDTIERMLIARAAGASLCPSEVARAAAPRGWRQRLDEVREVARHLARRGRLVITQRGRPLDPDTVFRGPVRLTRSTPPEPAASRRRTGRA